MLFPQPHYRGPSNIRRFTPASFAEAIASETHSKNSKVTWLIEFYAPWAPHCLHLEPVFAELSLQYGSEDLKFGILDVSQWPLTAKQYQVSIRGDQGNQLPTLIMFKNGKEIGRIPHVYEDGRVASGGTIRRRDIVTAFELDKEESPQAVNKRKGEPSRRRKGA